MSATSGSARSVGAIAVTRSATCNAAAEVRGNRVKACAGQRIRLLRGKLEAKELERGPNPVNANQASHLQERVEPDCLDAWRQRHGQRARSPGRRERRRSLAGERSGRAAGCWSAISGTMGVRELISVGSSLLSWSRSSTNMDCTFSMLHVWSNRKVSMVKPMTCRQIRTHSSSPAN